MRNGDVKGVEMLLWEENRVEVEERTGREIAATKKVEWCGTYDSVVDLLTPSLSDSQFRP